MSKEHQAPSAYIELIERRYNVKIIDSHYILVDKKFNKYNTMLDIQLNETMMNVFKEKYVGKTSAMHVAWEICDETNSIRFFAEIGNNILLLLDTLKSNL